VVFVYIKIMGMSEKSNSA